MRIDGERPLFRDALTLSALLFTVFLVHPAHEADPFHLGVSALLAEIGPQPGPQPPCGNEPIPSYPVLKDSATVKSWANTGFGRAWKPPACTSWAEEGFKTLVTISARFSSTAKAEGLLRRVGAISELAGMRYWSTTHKRWKELVVDAYALAGPEPSQRREDFASEELKQGRVVYFEQVDNLSGKATYRMHIIEASASRLVINVENITTMRYHFIPIFHPNELQSVYFLDRESDTVWRYYGIMRTGKNVIAANESSSINRAVAFYRHLVGIPDIQEPPEAR